MATLSLRLPPDLDRKLADEAQTEDCPRSEVARTAIAEYLARRERERFMSGFLAEAKEAYADPEIRRAAQDLAEESLPLDNEALDIAEGRKSGQQGERWWK